MKLLIFVCFLLFAKSVHSAAEVNIPQIKPTHSMPRIDFYPQELKSVVEDERRHVSFGINWENSNDSRIIDSITDFHGDFQVFVLSEDTKILEIVNYSYPSCIRSRDEPKNFSFTVKGIFLGFTKVKVNLIPAVKGCETERKDSTTSPKPMESTKDFDLVVSVIRPPSLLVNLVTGAMAALVAFNYINMGVQLDLHCIAKVLKKPIGPAIGFVCQFLFMPLVSNPFLANM
ncbi:p3 protein [Trichonephila clavata]|uniref:p3 protein n=1 Tax=Trichonephila clavata TaxID=2740835 RepID=A0A8X6J0L6_TRICU|nr:p3 protein [Trichonephila clavata]